HVKDRFEFARAVATKDKRKDLDTAMKAYNNLILTEIVDVRKQKLAYLYKLDNYVNTRGRCITDMEEAKNGLSELMKLVQTITLKSMAPGTNAKTKAQVQGAAQQGLHKLEDFRKEWLKTFEQVRDTNKVSGIHTNDVEPKIANAFSTCKETYDWAEHQYEATRVTLEGVIHSLRG